MNGSMKTRGFVAALVVLAAVLVGGSNASAATGDCPRSGLEKYSGVYPEKGLHAVDTRYGVDRFSILEPMTTERLKELPCGLKSWLAFASVDHRKSRQLREKSKGRNSHRQIVRPRLIAAWGTTTLSDGQRVDVVSQNGKICLVERLHAGNCGKIGYIEARGLASTTYFRGSVDKARTVGLVPDNVVSMTLEYPGFGDVPIKDNVFETTDIPDHRFFIIGRDAAGAVTTSVFVRSR